MSRSIGIRGRINSSARQDFWDDKEHKKSGPMAESALFSCCFPRMEPLYLFGTKAEPPALHPHPVSVQTVKVPFSFSSKTF